MNAPAAAPRDIVIFGHPVLRQKGRPAGPPTEATRKLVEDMLATMYAAQGIGLAAQQIGIPLQLAVVDVRAVQDPERPSTIEIDGQPQPVDDWMPIVLIDAAVHPDGPEKSTAAEGCLSFPEITGDITRPERICVTTYALDGTRKTFSASGLLARAIQHEHDHLQGILFIDRMSPAARAALQGKLKRMKRETESNLKAANLKAAPKHAPA